MFDVDQQTLDRFVSKLLERAKNFADKEAEECALVVRPTFTGTRGRGRGRHFPSGSRSDETLEEKQPARDGEPITCHYCRKIGHMKNECLRLKRKN